jgi:hypothetical protein
MRQKMEDNALEIFVHFTLLSLMKSNKFILIKNEIKRIRNVYLGLCLEGEKFKVRVAADLEFCNVNLQPSRYRQHNDIARRRAPFRRLGRGRARWHREDILHERTYVEHLTIVRSADKTIGAALPLCIYVLLSTPNTRKHARDIIALPLYTQLEDL